MVCDSCQSKVKKVIVPDKWKEGSRNAVVKAGKTNKVYRNTRFLVKLLSHFLL